MDKKVGASPPGPGTPPPEKPEQKQEASGSWLSRRLAKHRESHSTGKQAKADQASLSRLDLPSLLGMSRSSRESLIHLLTTIWQDKDKLPLDWNIEHLHQYIYDHYYASSDPSQTYSLTDREIHQALTELKQLTHHHKSVIFEYLNTSRQQVLPANAELKAFLKHFRQPPPKTDTSAHRQYIDFAIHSLKASLPARSSQIIQSRLYLSLNPVVAVDTFDKLVSLMKQFEHIQSFKMVGPASLGERKDQLVIYLSDTWGPGLRAFIQTLHQVLDEHALTDQSIPASARINKGMYYSESRMVGQSSRSKGGDLCMAIAAALKSDEHCPDFDAFEQLSRRAFKSISINPDEPYRYKTET